MIVKLPFGGGSLPVDLRGIRVRPIEGGAPVGASDPTALIARALDEPLAGPPLTEICAAGGPATVVVPDATRDACLHAVLPEILDRIRRGGVAESDITILVACGTHPPADERALNALVGNVPASVRVLQHDARDDGGLAAVGSVGDLPVRLNRLVVQSRILVTVSVVKHHYFAGFGGGPKMVFPGVAGYREIQANHARVVTVSDHGLLRNPFCEPGVLDGNPVAEEIFLAADLRPPDVALCMVPGRRAGVAAAIAGPWRPSFEAAVDLARRWYETDLEERFSLAVASGGGAPHDATLIQAHKALDAACRFLVDGGELLFVADLSQGAGSPDMAPFLDRPEPGAILDRLASGWVQYGHTALRLVEKAARFRIHLASRLDPELASHLGFHPVTDPSEVIETWRRTRAGHTAAVLAGPAVYPTGS